MNKYLVHLVVYFVLLAPVLGYTQATPPEPTIYPVVSNGYWRFPSTWSENRIPNEDDIVLLDKPVVLRNHQATVSGLVIERGGGVRGYSSTYRGGLTVTDYFKNNGSVGGNLRPFSVGGYIENNGPVSGSNQVYIRPGELTVVGDLNMQVSVTGPLTLLSNFRTSYNLYTNNQTIQSNGHNLQFNHINGDLTVTGSSSITIEGVSNQEVFLGAIVATSSQVTISSDRARMLGSITAAKITIDSQVYMPNTQMRFTGDTVITPLGQLFGNRFHVRQITYFTNNLTNYGTLGPYVQPHINHDFTSTGTYRGQEVLLLGSGVRNIVGVIPARVILGGDQTWNTSPTIRSLSSGGYSLTIPEGNTLHTSGIDNPAHILGLGRLVVIDPEGEESTSPNVQEIHAPKATVSLTASDARLGGDITAHKLEILNSTIVSQNTTSLQADSVSFDNGSLVVSGNTAYKRRITITTEELLGTGRFGSHTKVSVNTSIPKGFTAGYNTEINLFQSTASWGGTYRLSGALTNFMSGIDSVFDYYKAPNLANALNSGLPHYYSYQSALGWTTPLSVNAGNNPFTSSSNIAKRNFFTFSFIPNQTAGQKFTIVVTTPSDREFSETVFLSNNQGFVYPHKITLTDGVWQGEIELFDTGAGQKLTASGINTYLGYSGRSNSFANTSAEIATGHVRGLVRGSDAVRADHGTLVFNNTTDGSEYAVEVNQLGGYITELPAGEYFVQTTNALPIYITVTPNETTNFDIVLNALCEPSDKVPVLLVPGIEGSDSSHKLTEIFPRLTKHVPAWDSGTLHVHDPFRSVGFTDLIEAFENEGYQKNCTVFTAPYDWSLSVVDAAEQFLKPMIDHAKQVSSSTQVDIVAHSMGGLVSRAYIQGLNYENDVRKLAMAGTPNSGSVQAYFSWEGGDPIQADSYGGNLLDKLSAGITQSDQFQTKTLAKNYQVKLGTDEDPCVGFGPPLDYIHCNRSKLKNFLRDHAPAVGELFPTYDFLKVHSGETETFTQPQFENKILKALNDDACINGPCDYQFTPYSERGVDTQLFIGAEESGGGLSVLTPELIHIDNTTKVGDTYTDGEIKFVSMGVGDGTVLVDSVQEIVAQSATVDDKHASLLKKSQLVIINFIIK